MPVVFDRRGQMRRQCDRVPVQHVPEMIERTQDKDVRVQVDQPLQTLLREQVFEQEWLDGGVRFQNCVLEHQRLDVREVLERLELDELERFVGRIEVPVEAVDEEHEEASTGVVVEKGARQHTGIRQVVL